MDHGDTTMGYHIQWENAEKTILRCEIETPFAWDTYYSMVRERAKWLDSVNHSVDIIITGSENQFTLPPSALVNIRQLVSFRRHPNIGKLVVVNGPPLLEKLIRVLQDNFGIQIMPERIMLAETIDEAYAMMGYAQLN